MWRFNNFGESDKKSKSENLKIKRKYERTAYEQSIIETINDHPIDLAMDEPNHNQLDAELILANQNQLDAEIILANHNRLDPSIILANQNRLDPELILSNNKLMEMDSFEDETDDESFVAEDLDYDDASSESNFSDSSLASDLDNLNEYYNQVDPFEKEIYKNSEIKFKHFISIFVKFFGDQHLPDKTLDKILKFLRVKLPSEGLNIPKTYKSLVNNCNYIGKKST